VLAVAVSGWIAAGSGTMGLVLSGGRNFAWTTFWFLVDRVRCWRR
jgi:hypothetical protein